MASPSVILHAAPGRGPCGLWRGLDGLGSLEGWRAWGVDNRRTYMEAAG
jgi:hypothetical protein